MRQHVLLALAAAAAGAGERYYEPNAAYRAFPDLECSAMTFLTADCDCSTSLTGAHVRVEEGACRSGDVLIGPAAAELTRHGIAGAWDAQWCDYELKGQAPLSVYATLLTKVEFKTSAADLEKRDVRFTLGHAAYSPKNGHFYEWFDMSSAARYAGQGWKSWQNAQYFCAHPDQDVFGLVGYLATMTSEEEKDIINDNHVYHKGQGWLGGSDVAEEGNWRWIVGPEGCPGTYQTGKAAPVLLRSACDIGVQGDAKGGACTGTQCDQGTLFWKGGRYKTTGDCNPPTKDCGQHVDGAYHHWRPGAPDNKKKASNAKEGDHFATTQRDLLWNDLPARHNTEIQGYVCEWGEVGTQCLSDSDITRSQRFVHKLNECVDDCATCQKGRCDDYGQTCHDPTDTAAPDALGDWTCTCPVGKDGMATADTAACSLDECAAGQAGDTACMGQTCADPVKLDSSLMDFTCTCVEPAFGSAKGMLATCEVNECIHTDEGKMCAAAGQGCEDRMRDPTSLGDFMCTCPPPSAGSDTGKVAFCLLDECALGDGKTLCADQGQGCVDQDDDSRVLGDFLCTCPSPQTGSATGKLATCELDECADGNAGKAACGADQNCVDTNLAVDKPLDFECSCIAPQTGRAVGAKAACELDECHDGGALKAACETAAPPQICIDPSPRDDGDAFCQCHAPAASLKKIGGPRADCDWDECTTHGGTCHRSAQDCEDPDVTVADNWVCMCIPPQYTVPANTHGAQEAAMCLTPVGDCTEHTDCADAGQTCDALADDHDDVFECHCTPPSTGAVGKNGAATCALDECTVTCTSCSKTPAHPDGQCGAQECHDPNPESGKEHDWVCRCAAPYTGTNIGAPATCTINECESSPADGCAHCAGMVCSAASQTCSDPDVAKEKDWVCKCPTGQDGEAEGKPAVCVLDECKANAGTCDGQTCEDADTSVTATGGWECVCDNGVRATAAKADCGDNECIQWGWDRWDCILFGQDCVDPDFHTEDDWRCECRAPLTGTQLGGWVRHCAMDECVADCDTCAEKVGGGDICAAAGQLCVDADTSDDMLGDWVCECVLPAGHASAVGAPVAQCPDHDECKDESEAVIPGVHLLRYGKDHGCKCESNWTQTSCHDPTDCHLVGPGSPDGGPCVGACCNPDQDPGGDWCFIKPNAYNEAKYGCNPDTNWHFSTWDGFWDYCMPRGALPSDGGVPVPFFRDSLPGVPDEQSNVCTDVGQKCVDPSSDPNDWWCECLPPFSGSHAALATAACQLDECDQHEALCHSVEPPQGCEDPDTSPAATDDWMCTCPSAPTFTQVRGPVPGCPLDECTETCATCAFNGTSTPCDAVNQSCVDPAPLSNATGDWTCACVAPLSGTNKAAAAMCSLDECTAVCSTCMRAADGAADVCFDAGQMCVDVDSTPGSTGDWVCRCQPPSTTEAVIAAAAACYVDECRTDPKVNCTVNYQDCTDPDLAVPGDWFCACQLPLVGLKVQGVAACKYDECQGANQTECANNGQACEDADPAAFGTWHCKCIRPDEEGPDGLMAAAACVKMGECETNAPTCEDASQHCHDGPGDMDWACQCIAPYTGADGAMGPANCTLDECAAVCPTCMKIAADAEDVCGKHGQACVDADPANEGTWQCQCRAPATGAPGVRTAATCELDECEAACGTCEAEACKAANPPQTCEDVDTSETATGDWVCKCGAPSENRATGKVAPDCAHDECHDAGPKDACEAAGQYCVDADAHVEGDWACFCKPPGSVSKVGAPADHCDEYNECIVRCSTCAGDTCTAAGQLCRDPDHTAASNWVCECMHPAVGTKAGAAVDPADCELDECSAECVTCADQGSGLNLCEQEGQVCEEGSTAAGSKSDWLCRCPEPLTFVVGTASLALCKFDECLEIHPGETTIRGKVCEAAAQTCRDPSHSAMNDFICGCVEPAHGAHTGAPAVCTLNECKVEANNQTCTDASQECVDPSVTTGDDWSCVCAKPSTAKATKKPVDVCGVDECADTANARVCSGETPVQECVDEDQAADGSWECRCTGLYYGSQVAAPATCALDECEADCATCEKNACGVAGQECEDLLRGLAAPQLGDWVCKCAAPSTDTAVGGAVARCTVDECLAHGATCVDAMQACTDPSAALGDWQCECAAPNSGVETAAPAACTRDECKETTACSAVGQRCHDADTAVDKLSDWVCRCIAPAVEVAPGNQAPATCSMDGECADMTNAEVCTVAGQTCFDPDASNAGDWVCKCVPPAMGASGIGAPGACTLDECDVSCPSCAGGACLNAGQSCHDADPRPASVNDWECRCVAPKTGSAVKEVAACLLDECLMYASTCTAMGQVCLDVATDAEGNWACSCRAPTTGVSVTAGPATCTLDECVEKAGVCSAAGQTCADPDRSTESTGDWTCTCMPPSTTAAVAMPAVCAVDECALYGGTCTAAEQDCVDEDTALDGDWYCHCHAPVTTRAKAAAAVCELDECAVAAAGSAVDDQGGNVCAAAGQTCEDPDRSDRAREDWVCRCAAPSTSSATGAPAVCSVDACMDAMNAKVCADASQQCVDSDFHTAGFSCECVPPAEGTLGENAPGVCALDECAEYDVCQNAGQICHDPNVATPGDWECSCATGEPNAVTMALATCPPPTGSECALESVAKQCTDAGQVCHDPNAAADGDWECQCVPPAAGAAQAGRAAACTLDECAAACSGCAGTICSDAGQTCRDPNIDAAARHDWACHCQEPKTGSKVAGKAACSLNECDADCATCAGKGPAVNVCIKAGQLCEDPATDARSTNDWVCRCKAPAAGEKRGAPAVCAYDECANGAECAMEGGDQACVDPNKAVDALGDWACECVAPGVGRQVGGAAMCAFDECNVMEHAAVCASAGQVCRDPGQSADETGDWECVCLDGAGARQGAPAACELDECAPGNDGYVVCASEEQDCADSNTAVQSKKDWECVCPGGGGRARGAPAVCDVDECADAATAKICTDAGQTCIDLDKSPGAPRTWQCQCTSPATGYAVGAPAACLVDECITSAAADACAAASPPQQCQDPDQDAAGNWVCVCPRGATGADGQQAAAVCTFGETDECGSDAFRAVCAAEGQDCVDPNPDVGGDWVCACRPPAKGASKTQAPASCVLNECTGACPTCENDVCMMHEQACEDPSESSSDVGDWMCVCAAPAEGSKTGGPAECTVDECIAAARVCASQGQTCFDPDQSRDGTFTCQCVPPAVGSAVRQPAECAVDECQDPERGGVCRAAGQACVDPTGGSDDWMCTCVGADGQTVTEVMGAAACEAGEWCNTHGATCTAKGQQCIPTDGGASGACRCLPPQVGADAPGTAAACTLDECTAPCETCAGTTCSAADQECSDPNHAPDALSDWTCACATGAARQGAPASCATNECVAEGARCRVEEQACVDPDGTVTGDWYCECPAPKTGKAVAGVAECELDECVVAGGVCSSHAQTCVDPDKKADNDWTCLCVAPARGKATGGAAECSYDDDDECGDEGVRKQCADLGQACVDPSGAAGDWTCLCVPPQAGPAGAQGRASCTLDECRAVCATCAHRTGQPGNVCDLAGQRCVDPSTDPAVKADWMCQCASPKVGTALGAPAACGQDECDVAANRAVCEAQVDKQGQATQVCLDPDASAEGDWACQCVAPYAGAPAQKAAAKCTIDECVADGGAAACAAEGQACTDPAQAAASRGDWFCVCSYTQQTQVGAPVSGCRPMAGACAGQPHETCRAAGQTCVEKREGTAWACACLAPSAGEAIGAAAACELNECAAQCPTCAQQGASHTCADAGQACEDPDTTQLGDWACVCASGDARATAAAAACTVDECADSAVDGACTAAGQTCQDPSHMETGDWTCVCAPPLSGAAVRGPAACRLDECVEHAASCGGQDCVDVNQSPDAVDTWWCKCGAGASGTAQGRPAECTYTYGGCAEEANRKVCEDAGQVCSPSTVDPADWRCACAPPSQGAPVSQGPAACAYDECVLACVTCAKTATAGVDVCAAAGQECVDPDASIGSKSDWVCRCAGGVERTGAPVPACGVDECAAGGAAWAVCTAAGQECVDDAEALNTWRCVCQYDPSVSAPLQPVAGCGIDECLATPENAAVCTTRGQACEDPDTQALGTWGCRCVSGVGWAEGTSVASCSYPEGHECSDHASVCEGVGQACVDPDIEAAGDWRCECVAPAAGAARAGPAACVLDECATPKSACPTCAGAACGVDQDCVDPDMGAGATSDWECRCAGGLVGAAVVGQRALCNVTGEPASAAGLAKDEDCSNGDWWGCYWWLVLLLLLLLLCCSVGAALLALRKRQEHAGVDENKWNKHFEMKGDDMILEELQGVDAPIGGTMSSPAASMTMQCSDAAASQSLLQHEHPVANEGPRSSTAAGSRLTLGAGGSATQSKLSAADVTTESL